ncbi:MAG: cytidylate kinase-like family protein [Candidatus Faecousia sp.]|nr:cytidylate kinase-like family protein [Clostridiales bacterium]MDD7652271.1 cytidylate kinase-like family protein [Bacillota bacterium]MDY4219525.1 cytidylate kinase-like family protein [Candidatus Faecousia sp.]
MEKFVITIARQHGSGGRLIGECLAKKMGIAYYDKELISLTAKKTGFATDFVKEVEEKQTSSFLYSIYAAATVPSVYEQARNAQFAVIRELADKGPCVIVGRAADSILRGNPNCVRVFIHAPMEERIRRARDDYREPMDNPEKDITKKDKSRAAFYNTYSEYPWGDIRNYDMALNSSIGIERSADIIYEYVKARFGL